MKREERDADRQPDVAGGNLRQVQPCKRPAEEGIDPGDRRPRVFEKHEQPDVQHDGERDGAFAFRGIVLAIHSEAEEPVCERRAEEQEKKADLAPAVKDQAHHEEEKIPQRKPRQERVDRQDDRQKEKEEKWRTKNHWVSGRAIRTEGGVCDKTMN